MKSSSSLFISEFPYYTHAIVDATTRLPRHDSAMPTSIPVPRRLIDKFLGKMLPLADEVSGLLQQNAEQDGLTPRLKESCRPFSMMSA